MNLSVLFVDDNKSVLQGIKRVLTMERGDVYGVYCTGADDALNVLESVTFDAVVADYRMPGQDGLIFLATVRDKYPDTKLILLSGQSESEIYEKSSSIVDLYIAKPCEVLDMIGEIEKLLAKD